MRLATAIMAMGLGCGSAFAQTGATRFDGDWSGKGTLQMGPMILACQVMKMRFVGTPTLFGVGDAVFECEQAKHSDPTDTRFDIRGDNEVWLKGQKVGNVAENEIKYIAPDIGESENEVRMVRIGDLLYFYLTLRKSGQPPAYSAVAIMTKVANTDQPTQ